MKPKIPWRVCHASGVRAAAYSDGYTAAYTAWEKHILEKISELDVNEIRTMIRKIFLEGEDDAQA